MSATGLLLGVLNIVVVVLILVLIGALLEWVAKSILNMALDPVIRRIYLAIVAVIAIIMLAQLLLGVPFQLRVIG